MLTYDTDKGGYQVDISKDLLENAPRYDENSDRCSTNPTAVISTGTTACPTRSDLLRRGISQIPRRASAAGRTARNVASTGAAARRHACLAKAVLCARGTQGHYR
jgi:hypothetical protein